MNPSNITGKTRAARIPLDYYKKPDPVFRKKILLTAAAVGATIAWIVTVLPARDNSALGTNRFSHGPLCTHHQPFAHDCSIAVEIERPAGALGILCPRKSVK